MWRQQHALAVLLEFPVHALSVHGSPDLKESGRARLQGRVILPGQNKSLNLPWYYSPLL